METSSAMDIEKRQWLRYPLDTTCLDNCTWNIHILVLQPRGRSADSRLGYTWNQRLYYCLPFTTINLIL